ncbi:hypothetical protein AWY89_11030 [Pasteurella multocida subsp. multocida]|nr:hypothetical protein AWY89_11030 [Pasteurella multocida subsp. multocida]
MQQSIPWLSEEEQELNSLSRVGLADPETGWSNNFARRQQRYKAPAGGPYDRDQYRFDPRSLIELLIQ